MEALLFNSFGLFTDAEPDDCVVRGWSPVSGTGSFYSARGIVLQASEGAAEHKARSRAGKILTTVMDSPSKSVSCRLGSPAAAFLILVCSNLLESKLRIRDEELQAAVS